MATTELQLYGVMGKPHSFSAKTAAEVINKICLGTITLTLPSAISAALSLPEAISPALSLPAAVDVSLEEC